MYSTALSLRTKDSIYHRRHFCISGDVRAAEVGGCCGSGCSRAGFSCSSVYDGSRFIYSHWLKQAALIRWTPFRISGCDGGGRTTARYARLEAVWNGAPCSSAVWSKKQCCRSGRISHRIRASDEFYEDLLGSHDEVEDNAATYDDFHHSYDEKRDRMKFHGENFRGRYKNEMDSKRKNLQSAHRSNFSSSDQTTSSFSSSLAESGSNKLRKGQERIESSRYYRQNDERTEKKDWRNENASSLRSRFHESEGRFQSEAEAMNKEARKKDVRSSDHLFTGKKESKEDLEKVLTTSILHEKNSKETSAQSKRILSVFKEEALASDLLEELKRQRAEIEQLRRDYQELLRTTKKEETNATKASSSSNVAYSKMEKQEEKSSMEMILLEEVRRQRFEMEQLNANCRKLMSSIKTEERESSSRKSSRKVLDDREELVQSSKQDNQTSNYTSKDHHETDAGRYSNYTNVSDKNEKIATSSAYMIEEDQQVRSNIVQEDHSIRSTTLNESSQEISERMNIQSSRVDTDSKLKVNVQKEGTSSAVSSVNERRTEVRNDTEISSKTQNRVEVLMKDREEVSTSTQHLIKVEREKRIRDDRQVILELNVGEESQGQCLVPDVYLIGTGTVSDTRVDQKQILISTSKENPGKIEKKQETQERASTLIKDQKAGVSDSQLSSESKSMDYDSSLHLVLEAKRRQKSTGKLEAHFSFSENVEDQSTSLPLEPFIGKIKQNLSPRDKPNSASSSLSDTWIKESQPSSYWMEESQPASLYIEENQPTSFHKEENQLPSSRLEGSEPSSFYIEESQPASSQMGGGQPLSFHMEENQPSSFHVEEILPSSFRMKENRPSSFCMEESQSSSFRMEESQSTSFHIEESQPLSFPMEGTQPSSFHMEESRPSSLKMEEIQPLSFIVEESQPSSFRATESQPSSFHTEESQPSSFYIEEIMTPSVPIEESQPSSFPSLSRPSIAGASSQSQIEESQLSPPQSQPSTVRYSFEIPIEEIQPPQFQIEENYPLPSLSRPVTAGVSSESMICESQPSLSWIDKSQPGPSQSDRIFSESQMEKSQLSTKQSQPSTARTSSQIEESQPSLLLIEENQPSVFQSQPSTAMASFKSEIKESPLPLLQMAERQQLHGQNQTSGDKVSSESPSENRLLPLLQRTKSQLSFEQSQTSSVRVSSESLIEENQQPPLAIENSQLNRSQQSTAATSPLTKRSGKSLWSFVADIFRVNWRSHVDPQKSTIKVVTKSSSNESVSSEAWYSGHELDHDEEERRTTVVESEPSKSTADNQSAPSISGPSSSRADGENKPEKRKLFRSNKQVKRDEVEESTDDDQLTLIKPHFHSGMVISGSSSSSGTERREGEQMREDESEKRKLLKRIKQVKREEVEQWEDAYRIETEQRKIDEFFMREALVEAKKAGDMWEVPVGAVLVQDGKIIARGSNLVEDLRDSTAHAEMICIREASNVLRTWRLAGTTLYVTLEPCPMCAGAILQARIDTIVWGAPNKLLGADGSWIRLFPGEEGTEGPVHPFHPKMKIRRGVLATECADAMQQFFQRRRKKNRADQPPQPPPPPPSSMINYPAKLLTKMQNILCMMVCM